ncbi:MAG TPA: EutN/CcmL family microcompartment protein [Planctomycetota bacterium]|nr:EutN/CcmL family microcompartment protein [Planctomycetota bacterium]HRU51979.1 EutN/CcmL family microcompartment protein [Planctomycetota bacterium]
MLLGRVIGTVWATRKDEKLEGMRLLIVQAVNLEKKPLSNFVIAVDSVSADIGEIVLVAQGSSARQTRETNNKPVDAVIMAIVENMSFSSIEDLEAQYKEREKEIVEHVNNVPET